MGGTTEYVLMAVFLLLSAFFSGSETALVSMTKLRIRQAIERHGSRGEALNEWLNHSDRLLTTILVGNNIANIAGTSIAALLVSRVIGDPETAVWVNTIIMTSLILVLSEIFPKQIAKRRPEMFAIRVIRPLSVVSFTLMPIVWFFGGLAHLVARMFGATSEESGLISRSDVGAMLEAAGEEGSIASHEQILLEEALEFRHATIREIMTPRVKMHTIGTDVPISEAKRIVASTGYSRVPVEGATEGEIVGVLFAKDLLLAHESEDEPVPLVAADVMRPPHFIPEMVSIDRLMEQFRHNQVHIAIVIGEYGDVVGLVTMENVLEKLVGQIEDEFDASEADIKQLSERRYIVKGSARLDDLRRELDIDLPEGDYETIGGYLINELGRIPSRGAATRWEEWLFQVYDADERRVLEVSFQKVGRVDK
jgi:putative hemolysin